MEDHLKAQLEIVAANALRDGVEITVCCQVLVRQERMVRRVSMEDMLRGQDLTADVFVLMVSAAIIVRPHHHAQKVLTVSNAGIKELRSVDPVTAPVCAREVIAAKTASCLIIAAMDQICYPV